MTCCAWRWPLNCFRARASPVYRLQDVVLGPDVVRARLVEFVADDLHAFLERLLAAIQVFASTGTLVDL